MRRLSLHGFLKGGLNVYSRLPHHRVHHRLAWPDVEVERPVIEARASASWRVATPAPAAQIEALVEQHQPAGILTNSAPGVGEGSGPELDLRMVGRTGVGLDNIAVEECNPWASG